MGFTSSLDSISADRVESLLIIDAKWRELEAKKAEQRRKGGKRG